MAKRIYTLSLPQRFGKMRLIAIINVHLQSKTNKYPIPHDTTKTPLFGTFGCTSRRES